MDTHIKLRPLGSTAEGVMYRDLNRFTLNGITLKEASKTTLELMKKTIIFIFDDCL